MKRLFTLLILSLGLTVGQAQSAPVKAPDIHTLEHAFSQELHLRATHIPMMGMASRLAGAFTTGGVRGLKAVSYDSLPDELDHVMIAQLARVHLSGSWSMMVHEKEAGAGGEDEMVWVQPAGERIRMLVIDLEANEMNMIQMELSPGQLAKWKDQHGGDSFTGSLP